MSDWDNYYCSMKFIDIIEFMDKALIMLYYF